MPQDFDITASRFTEGLKACANWKHAYFGADHSTRIRAAIKDLKMLIAEVEGHPEIGTVE